MDAPDKLIQSSLEPDGVLVARIDMPGRTMNVFSHGLMDALDMLIERAEQDPGVKSVVITSGKPTFLAGADLVMVRGYTDQAKTATHAQMFETCGRLGRQYVRLERCPKPWVAAVNGIALGGGLELALACRQRIVADDPRIQLGVPEVRWGLLPGAGGTQRLPRVAGLEVAMDLLLSGRSIDPATALKLGIVNAVVPAPRLLDDARVAARAMHGQPYSASAKFRQLEQSDVPAWSEVVAREIAARHGVDGERFDLYPAYSAIVDSVLKGARLPLAEATAVEMNQFLRLMFSPVAGRMIRTLFLERLRAERELAAPEGLKIEAIERGTISEARGDWAAALSKLKLPLSENTALAADTMVLIDNRGRRHLIALRVLDESTSKAALPQAVLAPSGPYGRVLEIAGANDDEAAALAALAARLWALPWRTPGADSVLQRLRGLPLAQQARAARACAAQPGFGEAVFLDVAACLAGIAPAWSGGPLTWADSAANPASSTAAP